MLKIGPITSYLFDTGRSSSSGVLARIRPAEVQAAVGQDHAVPHPDAEVAAEAAEEVGAAAKEGRTTGTAA